MAFGPSLRFLNDAAKRHVASQGQQALDRTANPFGGQQLSQSELNQVAANRDREPGSFSGQLNTFHPGLFTSLREGEKGHDLFNLQLSARSPDARRRALRAQLSEAAKRAGTFSDTAEFESGLVSERKKRQAGFDRENQERINSIRKELGLAPVTTTGESRLNIPSAFTPGFSSLGA